MAARGCRECGAELSLRAASCPLCGTEIADEPARTKLLRREVRDVECYQTGIRDLREQLRKLREDAEAV